MEHSAPKTKYITFTTLGCGKIRLGGSYVTRDNLQKLCQVKELLLLTKEGDEIKGEDLSNLNASEVYTVASEADLESDEEDQNFDPKKEYQAYLEVRNRMERMKQERVKMIAKSYKRLHEHLWTLTEVSLNFTLLDDSE